jgi:hypothetical protein
LASFHLEGEAKLWFQFLLREGREIGFPEFKEGVFAHFGPTQFYDPFGELTKLQQEGSIRHYQAKFESLLSKIRTLSQSQQANCHCWTTLDSHLSHRPSTSLRGPQHGS